MNPFDFVNDILYKKKNLIKNSDSPELTESQYSPFLTNKALSFHVDCILYANTMNMYNKLDKKLQYDFYLNTIRSTRRHSKWIKNEDQSAVELVSSYFKCNYTRAREILEVLTPDAIEKIRKKQIEGGVNECR